MASPLQRSTLALWIAALAIAPGCKLGTYEDPDAGIDADAGTSPLVGACSLGCHGHLADTAPPTDTLGNVDTSAPGVGAHQAHLKVSDWHQAVTCQTCHVVPVNIGDPGHIDTPLPAELVTDAGFMATTTYANGSCTNNYCHGATLKDGTGSAGGSLTSPTWTEVGVGASACGACHGAPPPSPHPSNKDCGQCHPSMNPGDGMKIAYPELHINGHVDVNVASTQACDACHGAGGDPAPPKDTLGKTATTAKGVGAHANHLSTSTWHKQVACVECHLVPTSVNDLGHVDTPLPAEVIFGPLAGATGTWDETKCSNTYCHGSTLTGGNKTSPIWTQVDGTQSQCGSCHGAPPPSPHPTDPDCGKCHPTMTPGGGLVIAFPDLHIDGKVDVVDDKPCDFCHGTAGNPAPPKDTLGNTSTALRGIGAHRSHLGPSTLHKEIPCSECHLVPIATNAVGHMDTPLPAEVIFGPLAGNATWNGNSCSTTYCHGSTLTGGTSTVPVWTKLDGSQAQCGSCHGTPPPPPHPVDPDCGSCHDTMTPGGGLVITDPSRHIDGNLDVNTDKPCDACHGSGGNSAPPKSVGGATATTTRGVGAHRQHLGAATWHATVNCVDCHKVPATVTAIGHVDTALPAELTFSAKAGTTTNWTGSSCSNNYCHGASLTGGTATSPVWTKVDGTQSQCGSCHGAPPPAPHPVDSNCQTCHADAGPGLTIIDPTKHIDGNVDVTGDQACDSCHGTGGDSAPPKDTTGNVATTARGVGAHQSHLQVSTLGKTLVCSDCHIVPATVTAVGHIDTPLPAELTFTGRGAGTTFNGSSCTSYCHGSTLKGGTIAAPSWTKVDGSQKACGSCHGTPPPAPHPANSNCQSCHVDAGPGLTISDPTKHIDGVVQVTSVHPAGYASFDKHGYDFDRGGATTCSGSSCHGTALTGGAGPSCASCHASWQTTCTFCHGGTNNQLGSPPASVFALTAATDPAVGAHTAHVNGTTGYSPMACSTCHVTPSNALTSGHVDGDGRGETKFSSLNSAATYNRTTDSCGALYCHGDGRTNIGTATWTSTTPMTCTSCHGDRKTGRAMSAYHKDHHGSISCAECHAQVVNTAGVILDSSLHVNGVKNVLMSPKTGTYNPTTKRCTNLACHGDETWQ